MIKYLNSQKGDVLELVYLWVEDYKNIKKQGFNFSPRFRCGYDEKTNELTIDENDDYIPDFFGENINVTAIVGKNGSGKSSILDYLNSKPTLFITFENNQLNISQDIKVYNFTNYSYFFQSNSFDGIHPLGTRLLNSRDVFEWNNSRFKEQVYMYLKAKNSLKNIIFPKQILYIIEMYDDMSYNYPNIDIREKDFHYYQTVDFNTYYTHPIFLKKNIINSNLSDSVYFSMFHKLSFEDSLKDRISLERVQSYVKKNQNILSIKELFFNFEKELKNQKELNYYKELKDYAFLFEDFQDIYHNKKFISLKQEGIGIGEQVYPIPLNRLTKEILDGIQYHADHSLRWDKKLSSGEVSLINLLSQIFDVLSLESKDDFFSFKFLYIDEGESFLHPNWQKKYISYIIQFIKDNFPDRKIHIILTSHSPFLLSDIPKQNIIFLDKDEKGNCKVVDGLKEKKQTFGANIHTLLSDSFFMEDGLMGEFAKGKIDDVINYLHGKESKIKDNDEAQKLIHIIGEPIVKNQLQRMLDSKRLKKVDEIDAIKQSMEAMQKRLDELEK